MSCAYGKDFMAANCNLVFPPCYFSVNFNSISFIMKVELFPICKLCIDDDNDYGNAMLCLSR